MDEKDPPVRRLTLKPKEVSATDKPSRPGDGTAISVRLIHRENQLAEERRAGSDRGVPPAQPHDTGDAPGATSPFRATEVTPTDPPSHPGDPGSISVHEILSQNRRAAVRTEPELIAMPAPRKSRRNRDFAVLLGAAVLSTGVVVAVFRRDAEIISLALFGIVFTAAILAWIIYGVMDRY
jgi:hypothetical protein